MIETYHKIKNIKTYSCVCCLYNSSCMSIFSLLSDNYSLFQYPCWFMPLWLLSCSLGFLVYWQQCTASGVHFPLSECLRSPVWCLWQITTAVPLTIRRQLALNCPRILLLDLLGQSQPSVWSPVKVKGQLDALITQGIGWFQRPITSSSGIRWNVRDQLWLSTKKSETNQDKIFHFVW
jgi:hypothetical protein